MNNTSRIFVTGATGFIGSAIVQELIGAGYRVLGLARSDASAQKLVDAGAEVHRGALDDLDSLRTGAAESDGVIHTAFIHDFSSLLNSAETDRRAIETFGTELAGSGRPLVVAGGVALIHPGLVVTELDERDPNVPFPRVSEETALATASNGVRASVVRLAPTVHGEGDHGFIPTLIRTAREKGVSAYVGDGRNRWAAVHRLDAAQLFRLALEKASAGARLHAIAEEGILFRDIAEVIGRRLNIPVVSMTPEEAADHFGWFANFAAIDCPASNALTQELYGWHPSQPGLIADLDQPYYFETEAVA